MSSALGGTTMLPLMKGMYYPQLVRLQQYVGASSLLVLRADGPGGYFANSSSALSRIDKFLGLDSAKRWTNRAGSPLTRRAHIHLPLASVAQRGASTTDCGDAASVSNVTLTYLRSLYSEFDRLLEPLLLAQRH